MKNTQILTFEIVDSVNKILHDKDTNFLIKKYLKKVLTNRKDGGKVLLVREIMDEK